MRTLTNNAGCWWIPSTDDSAPPTGGATALQDALLDVLRPVVVVDYDGQAAVARHQIVAVLRAGQTPGRQSLAREQELVLLRLDAGGPRGPLAEAQKQADLVPELRERPVISEVG